MTVLQVPAARAAGAGRVLEYWLTAYRRCWRGSAVSGFLAPLLYLGALGFGVGVLVGDVAGVPYAAYVAPGLLAVTAMQTAVGESTYPVLGSLKWNRQYVAMRATPLRVGDLLLGHLAFILVRVLLGAVAFLAVGTALGTFPSPLVWAAVPVVVLCGAAHAAPVMAYAVRQDNDNGFPLIFRFVLVPMFLFAGTFFPVEQLPAVLRPVAWLTPLWHATSAARRLALGSADAAVLGHLAYLLLWTALGVRVALACYRRRLDS